MADEVVELDWNYLHLLAWYDKQGKCYSTTYDGRTDYTHVVVTSAGPFGPPMWNSKVYPVCKAVEIPAEITTNRGRIAYATKRGGVYAFGWKTEVAMDRS